MPVTKVKLTICGSNYIVSTTDSEEYVNQLAERLDTDMTEIMILAAAEPEMSDAEETVLGNVDEAITALMVLGYTRQEAQAALKGIAPLLPLEDMITAALRKMGAKL